MNIPLHTLADLVSEFLAWMDRESAAGRYAVQTARYYRHNLEKFLAAVGADKPLKDVVPYDLERNKTGWHSVQTVQRLFKWGVDMGLLTHSPFASIPLPRKGQRQRTLDRPEFVRLLRKAKRAFRRFLLAMSLTIARPTEIRALQWQHMLPDLSAFVLSDFKGKNRLGDGVTERTIFVPARLQRLLLRLRRRGHCQAEDFVFLNDQGRPWSANAVRLAMKRLRKKAGLIGNGQVENVVCYTLRHTAATNATANGIRDRVLADLMGHASTKTTARYQHLRREHLTDAIEQAIKRRPS